MSELRTEERVLAFLEHLYFQDIIIHNLLYLLLLLY